MQRRSKLAQFVLVSPLFLALFAIIPGMLLLSRLLHLHLPFTISLNTLIGNNICLLISLIVRLQLYLTGLRHCVLYGTDLPRRTDSVVLERSCTQVSEELSRAGFSFEASGCYGEKRNLAYWGTTLVYAGLVLMLSLGLWDNLRQFSGTIIKGPGAAVDLSQSSKYYHLITGPLASPAGLPFLKVLKQEFPGGTYPFGATEIGLYARDGKRIGGAFIDANKGPYNFGGYDYYLNSLLVDCALTIKTKGSFENNVFDEAVKLRPLYDKKVGDFTLYGTYTTSAGDDGEVWFDPTHNIFKISLAHDGKKVLDTDFAFQVYREKTAGDFVVSILGSGHWSELHVVRRRHMPLIIAGCVIAAVGLLIRILFRPQRVWLEKNGDGCLARFVGKNPLRDEQKTVEG